MEWGKFNAVVRGAEPTKIDRQFAVKMFGAKDTCLLKTHIIGPVKIRRESRTPMSEEGRKTFELIFD